MGVARGIGSPIAFNASGGAEDWIMLMPVPATRIVATVDGRGPYRIADAAKLATSSLQAHDGRIPIDENHSTDLAAPRGEPAPARGWATELQARENGVGGPGIYGKVEWSPSGAALMSEKSYRYISPVIIHDRDGNVLDLPRASLTNTPNLLGMAALNATENDTMDLLAQLQALLGLPGTADAAAVVAKVKSLCSDTSGQSIALAAGLAKDAGTDTVLAAVKALKSGTALASIAKAAGLKEDAPEAAIVTAITALASGVPDAVKALQTELAGVTTKLNAALTASATEKATAFVDNAIKAGVVGVKPAARPLHRAARRRPRQRRKGNRQLAEARPLRRAAGAAAGGEGRHGRAVGRAAPRRQDSRHQAGRLRQDARERTSRLSAARNMSSRP